MKYTYTPNNKSLQLPYPKIMQHCYNAKAFAFFISKNNGIIIASNTKENIGQEANYFMNDWIDYYGSLTLTNTND